MAAEEISSQKAVPGAFRQGLMAAKANIIPGAIIQTTAVCLLVAYYTHQPTRDFLARVGEFKTDAGLLFPIISTAFFGAILPFMLQFLNKNTNREKLVHLPAIAFFWAVKGIEIDLLYKAQTYVFGNDPSLQTVLTKMFFDQVGYCMIWAVPSMTVYYMWKENNYSFAKTRAMIGKGFYREKVTPVLVANWLLWVPSVAVIYCLDSPLQLPMQNLILCMWGLLMIFLGKKTGETPKAE